MKRKQEPSVGIVVLAYNEVRNLTPAIEALYRDIPPVTRDFEIIIVDDGSTDGTGALADRLARKYPEVKTIHHPVNRGFAATFLTGVAAVTKKYTVSYPGDYDTSSESLAEIIRMATPGSVVISYPENPETRSPIRRVISRLVVVLLNLLFSMKLRYYTGSFICETGLLRKMRFYSRGFAVYAEAKIRLHRMGLPFLEIPFVHIGRKHGTTNAISVRSFLETFETILKLKLESTGEPVRGFRV